VVVLWDIQISTDENTLAAHFAAGTQIREANDVHGECEFGLNKLAF
jgi:hypothetical protein